jgi:hypothetical protein
MYVEERMKQVMHKNVIQELIRMGEDLNFENDAVVVDIS